MKRCIDLAKKGRRNVSPNPMVGSVIVNNNTIIGEGYHKKYGENHAEINAINSVKNKSLLNRATLYVNLEPCSHKGKTPPCVDYIINQKISKVVIGSLEENPIASGGMQMLQEANIKVQSKVLQQECIALNKRFFTFHKNKRPYIILKWAQSKDKFISLNKQAIGKPIQISCIESKKLVHKWRSEEDAIIVGKNTVLLDNPQLTTRPSKGKNPIRIILDQNLEIKKTYKVFDKDSDSIIFNNKRSYLSDNNEFIKINSTYNLNIILKKLYEKNILSIIVEGGGILLNSFIMSNLWDEARVFTAKHKLGNGVKSPNFIQHPNCEKKINTDKLHYYYNKI